MWLEHPVYPSLCNVTSPLHLLYIIKIQKKYNQAVCVCGGGGAKLARRLYVKFIRGTVYLSMHYCIIVVLYPWLQKGKKAWISAALHK